MSNVFIVVGHSGSGKTTLVEKLLRELSGRGLRVATIKHAHHKVVLDTPGKDSFRYKQAGAVMSMLVTSNELQLVADAVERRDPEQLAERFLGEADLVLAVKEKQEKNPEQAVVIAADRNVRYEEVLNVMDILQQNHVQKIGLLAKPKGQ